MAGFMSHLVLLNILGGALQVAEPLGAVGSQELLDQVLSVHVEVARELNLARQNLQQKKPSRRKNRSLKSCFLTKII